MPTFKLKANEMKDATVSHISLVDRGANRIPFRIVKQEKSGMSKKHFAGLDLGNLFVRKTEEAEVDQEAEVVSVVVMDEDEEAKKLVEEAGFDVSSPKTMEDGSVVYQQGDKEDEGDVEGEECEVTVLKWNDKVALVMKGFSPYMMNVKVGETTFAEKCIAQGFYPGIRTVSEVLVESINSIVSSTADPNEAASQVATLCDEARDYITSLVGALPVKAFKLDKPMDEEEDPMKKKKKKKPVEEKPADGKSSESSGCAKAEFKTCPDCKNPKACTAKGVCAVEELAAKAKAKKADEDEGEDDTDEEDESVVKACKPKSKKPTEPAESAEPAKPAEGEGTPPKKGKPAAPVDTESTDEGMGEEDMGDEEEVPPKGKKKKPIVKQDLTAEQISSIVAAKFEESISKLTGLVEKQLQAISSRVEKAEATIADTTGKLKGVLVPGSVSGDPAPTQKSEKGNGVFGGRDIDTAFQPDIRTRIR